MSIQHLSKNGIGCLAFALGVMATAFLTPDLARAATPPSASVYLVGDADYAGSGCPNQSVSASLSEGRNALSLFLDAFGPEVGPHTGPKITAICNLSLSISLPEDWQYTLVRLGYNGKYYLDSKVKAEHRSEYFFEGESRGPVFRSNWSGPTRSEVKFTSDDSAHISENSWHWSPCGGQGPLRVRAKLVVDNKRNRDGIGYVGNDYIPSEHVYAIGLTYAIKWRSCSG